MANKNKHTYFLLLALALIIAGLCLPQVFAEETENVDNNSPVGGVQGSDAPVVIDVGDICSTILVPVSGQAQGGRDRTYAVAISNAGILDTSSTKFDKVNIWQDDVGTYTYIVGISEGETKFNIGDKTYTVRVVPRNVDNNGTVTFHFNSGQFDTNAVKMYYSVNGSTLYEFQPNEVLLDQAYPGYVNFMFFAAPQTKGTVKYALTGMYASGSYGQYYSLTGSKVDGTDSDAWPYVNGAIPSDDKYEENTDYPFKNDLVHTNSRHELANILTRGHLKVSDMRNLYIDAKVQGCDGVFTFNRQGNGYIGSTENPITISATAEKLPAMEKNVIGYKKSADTEWLTYKKEEPPKLSIGDKLLYSFTISDIPNANVVFDSILLADEQIGFEIGLYYDKESGLWSYRTDSTTIESSNGKLVITREYDINAKDAAKYSGGKFKNSATLRYLYRSKYSTGSHVMNQSSEVTCKILGIATYLWKDSLPEEIKKLPTPESHEFVANEKAYVSNERYDSVVCVDNDKWTKWTFVGWKLLQDSDNTTFYHPGDEVTVTEANSVDATFVGHWKSTDLDSYSITYQWEGLPDGTTGIVIPTGDSYYETQKYTVDSQFTSQSRIVIDGVEYGFSGWKLNETIVTGVQEMGPSNVELKGEWRKTGKVTLTITTKNCEDIDENQVFLFKVTGEEVNVTVAIKGNGSTKIFGLQYGETYTVTELTKWSWRYVRDVDNQQVEMKESGAEVSFDHTRPNMRWLDGNHIWNIFKKRDGEGA